MLQVKVAEVRRDAVKKLNAQFKRHQQQRQVGELAA